MDVTKLVARIQARPRTNTVVTVDHGRLVERTHADVGRAAEAAASALRAWGVKPGMRVGLRAPSGYEWMVYDLALIEVRAVCVAFTDDFAGASPDDLIRRYRLSLLLVGAQERHPHGTAAVAYIDGENGAVRAMEHGDAIADGDFDRPWMIFSSGSSGGLKGLTLNRKGVEDWVDAFTERIAPRDDDRLLLFLPFSNFQQRPMCYGALWHGVDLIITTPPRLFTALKQLGPTILVAPPTLYETFETRFSSVSATRRLLAVTLARIAAMAPAPLRRRAAKLIFRQAYDALGGRMRVMITGMAPIKRTTLELFELMQLPLFETYGLVECGSIALNAPGARKIGSVGRPLPGLQVSLADDGEIIVRREHPIAVGYFECAPGENERTFVGDHRVATGDHGRLDGDGYLYLVGRKKEIIITAGGEKVHPEAVEAAIDACPDVAKSIVFGADGADGATSLVAIVLLKRPDDSVARERVERFVERWNAQGRRRIEVGRLVFTDLVFSRENGFLRPNLKLDRPRIREHFRAQIEATTSIRAEAGSSDAR